MSAIASVKWGEEDRNKAPKNSNYDTLDEIKTLRLDIDGRAAFGPNAENKIMPPKEHDTFPSDAERKKLGEWLACLADSE